MSDPIRKSEVKHYEEVESDFDMSETEKAMKRAGEGQGRVKMKTDFFVAVSGNQEIKLSKAESSDDSNWIPGPYEDRKQKLLEKKIKEEAKLSLLPAYIGSCDVFLITEVFTRLDLGTLVYIAEVNKEFHHLLTKTDTGNSIFRAVRIALGLPLLKGMSEIHFASLCFGAICFACSGIANDIKFRYGGDVPKAMLSSRVRLCKSCLENCYIHDRRIVIPILSAFHPRSKEVAAHFILSEGSERIITPIVLNGRKFSIGQALEPVSNALIATETRVRNDAQGSAHTAVETGEPVKTALDKIIDKQEARFSPLRKESHALFTFLKEEEEAREKNMQTQKARKIRIENEVLEKRRLEQADKREALEWRVMKAGICTAE